MCGVINTRDDGTCVAGGWCKCNEDAIATNATWEEAMSNRFTYRVLERVNDHVIKVQFGL